MSAKLGAPSITSSAVRVTVEADIEGEEDSAPDEEEVEEIGSAETSTSSSEEAVAKAAEQTLAQKGKKTKRKSTSEASGAAGLANVLRGLLGKPLPPVATACPILAKALTDRQRFAPAAAAADKDDDDRTGIDMDDISATRRRRLIAERRRWLCLGRVRPSVRCGGGGDREAERELERIACRGVVQLFNAVRAQQRTLEARLAGKSEAGRQRVLSSLSKADFLDMLAGRKKKNESQPVAVAGGAKPKKKQQLDDEDGDEPAGKRRKSWGVLSDDYLVKPTLTMKDWDRESEEGDDIEHEIADLGQPMEEDK